MLLWNAPINSINIRWWNNRWLRSGKICKRNEYWVYEKVSC